jgi:hypothetical protein
MESFLRSNYGLRNLEAGSVSRVVSDVIGRNHGIVKVIGREEPPFEAMTATEYQQRVNQIERQKVLVANHRWTLPQLQVRREWKEN